MRTHVLSAAAIEGVDLPADVRETLTTRGVPDELRLPDWNGPTLFTSELGAGRLVSTAEPGALVARAGPDEAYVVGSVRETLDEPTVYAVFALRRGTGEVWLLDANDPDGDRFVSSGLGPFLRSLEAFRAAFDRMVADSPDRERIVASFQALLEKLDPRALDDQENYWPGWLEELH